MTSGRTGHWTKMHQSLVKFGESEASNHTPSLADFTTTTPELKFSVHTGRFGGDLAAYFQRSPVSADMTVSRVDFLAPVSASKNSVPGDWISRPRHPIRIL